MDYQIIHNVPGRLRLLIPRLATDSEYAQRLQGLVESIKFVTEVRINPWARSLVVSYKNRVISSEAFQKHLLGAIEQLDPSDSPPQQQTESKEAEEQKSREAGDGALYPEDAAPFRRASLTESAPQQESRGALEEKEISPPAASELVTGQKESTEAKKTAIEKEEHTKIYHQPDFNEDPWESDSKPDFKTDSIIPPAIEPIAEEVSSPEKNNISIETKTEKHEQISPLSTSALAKRLQVTSQALTRNRSKSDFAEWTRIRDPQGIAWKFEGESKTFYPITFSVKDF
jgi:hypothetical protein